MDEFPLTPTPDAQSPNGIYLPDNLPACFQELDRMLSSKVRERLRGFTEADWERQHFRLGLLLRNNWRLWSHDSPLGNYFCKNFGLHSADSLSHLILLTYGRYLNGQALELSREIVYDKILREEIRSSPRLAN